MFRLTRHSISAPPLSTVSHSSLTLTSLKGLSEIGHPPMMNQSTIWLSAARWK